MDRRSAAAEATRLRVVEAAVSLHGELGAWATSWADIAQRADVALGTVYRYFPGYDELIPACTSHAMALVRPPTIEMFSGTRSLRGRLSALVSELFGFYERAARWLQHGECDRRKIPALEVVYRRREAMFEDLVRVALGSLAARAHAIDTTLVVTSFASWKSFHDRGVPTASAADLVTDVIAGWLDNGGSDGKRRRKISRKEN